MVKVGDRLRPIRSIEAGCFIPVSNVFNLYYSYAKKTILDNLNVVTVSVLYSNYFLIEGDSERLLFHIDWFEKLED
jgi:hypothetical protein